VLARGLQVGHAERRAAAGIVAIVPRGQRALKVKKNAPGDNPLSRPVVNGIPAVAQDAVVGGAVVESPWRISDVGQ